MNQSLTSRRHPLLALSAGLLIPGLGQLYNGDIGKSISFVLGIASCIPVAAWLALHGPELMLSIVALSGFSLAVVVYFWALFDAFQSARTMSASYNLKPFNKWYVYLSCIIFGFFFVFSPLVRLTQQRLLSSYRVPTESMFPTIKPNEHFLADKRVACPSCGISIERGELAIFINPNQRSQQYVKRIIGLPGDKIKIIHNEVIVNDASIRGAEITEFSDNHMKELSSEYVFYKEHIAQNGYVAMWKRNKPTQDLSEFIVPNGQVFVLGDNRDNAHDSRGFGFVALADVLAKPKQIWCLRTKAMRFPGIALERF